MPRYVQACTDHKPLQYLEPEACQAYLQPDNLRPFSLKHAQQQASIVGHMQHAGLLQVNSSCSHWLQAQELQTVLYSRPLSI